MCMCVWDAGVSEVLRESRWAAWWWGVVRRGRRLPSAVTRPKRWLVHDVNSASPPWQQQSSIASLVHTLHSLSGAGNAQSPPCKQSAKPSSFSTTLIHPSLEGSPQTSLRKRVGLNGTLIDQTRRAMEVLAATTFRFNVKPPQMQQHCLPQCFNPSTKPLCSANMAGVAAQADK